MATKLRWYQFSLRSLLIFVTLWAIPCSWLGVKMKQAREQKAAVEWILGAKGFVKYDYETQGATPPGPAWLRRLLGDDFFAHVSRVDLMGPEITDVALERLLWLPQLEKLDLFATQTTDTGLRYVEELSNLRELDLVFARVTDAGLGHLKGLSRLRTLDLGYTRVTDAGLEQLKGSTLLTTLYLNDTQVTSAGVKKFLKARPGCEIVQ